MTDNAAIYLHKILVVPVVVSFMLVHRNGSPEAWLYLALHGAYSWMWLAKQQAFPDKRFAIWRPAWISLVFVFLPLNAYFAAPHLLISRRTIAPPWLVGAVGRWRVPALRQRRAEVLHASADARAHC